MTHYDYLIIGGGMTADSTVRGIREIDKSGSIALFTAESHPPYDRPPLSKKLWTGKPLESIWRNTSQLSVEIYLGTQITAISSEDKYVTDAHGQNYSYSKLMLATGGTPRKLNDCDKSVIYFRTLNDYQRLRKLQGENSHIVVIGGGFIGSEIAAALVMNGYRVTMIFPDKRLGEHVYPSSLSEFLNDYYQKKGVKLLSGKRTKSIRSLGKKYIVTTTDSHEIEADEVVAGIGILPEVTLAQAAELAVDNGIVVDEQLRTSKPDIYAAGDVANFYNPALNQRMRVEHEDNANTMGKIAGRNMAGCSDRYNHLPYFYSDLFELGYEAVGQLDSGLEIIEDWHEPLRKGVIYYLKEGLVRGVLLWNVWGKVESARSLIASRKVIDPSSLPGTIRD